MDATTGDDATMITEVELIADRDYWLNQSTQADAKIKKLGEQIRQLEEENAKLYGRLQRFLPR